MLYTKSSPIFTPSESFLSLQSSHNISQTRLCVQWDTSQVKHWMPLECTKQQLLIKDISSRIASIWNTTENLGQENVIIQVGVCPGYLDYYCYKKQNGTISEWLGAVFSKALEDPNVN